MKPQRLIIGFGYKRRSGKDLCGEMARSYLEELGRPARMDWFAYSLKRMCKEAFGFTDEQVWGDAKLELDAYWEMTPARALQLAGTEAMRHTFGENHWVRTVRRRLEHDGASCLICDVRFPNEAEAIKSWGGHVVRVDRFGASGPILSDGRDSAHESETALDNYEGWSAVIANDSSVAALNERVRHLVDELLAKEAPPWAV